MATGQLEDPIPAGAHETLPARCYTDRDVFAEETEKSLAGTWQLVVHRSQAGEKDDLIVATVAGRELMIVRRHDDVLRTFFNTCLHRGHRLVERGGNRRLITCPCLVESVQRSMQSRTFDRGFVLVDRDRSQDSEHGVKAFNDLYLRHMSGPDA